jgi:DHA1 family inner membrane transport protein
VTTEPGATGLIEADGGDVTFRRSAFVGATITLALIGGLAAAYGTILLGVASHFHVGVATAGTLLSANFGGGIVGVAACWRAFRRWPASRVWAVSLLVLSGGLGLAASAPTWITFVVGVTVAGVGFGALDFGIVALVARTARTGLAARMSVSGSGWAFGAIAGPVVIVIVRPHAYAWFLAGVAVMGVLLVALCRGVTASDVGSGSSVLATPVRVDNRRAVLVTFLIALGLYVAVESAVSGWLATQLHGWGYATVVGTSITAGFWAGLGIGRVSLASSMGRVAGHWFVLLGLGAAAGLLVGASDRALAPFAYPVVGFALAAVFPVGLHWFTELSPNDRDGVAWIVLADMAGGAIGTGAENIAVATFGLHAVPWIAVALAVACMGAFASALRFPTPSGIVLPPIPVPRMSP